MKKSLACLFVIAGLGWSGAMAGSDDEEFRKGLSAYNTGDFAKALNAWVPLARKGDGRAQAGLGFMYHRGTGVPSDDVEANDWLLKAAQHGQAEGQLMLGTQYFFGNGVEQSFVKAYVWCELSEGNGNSDATFCREAALQNLNDREMTEAFAMAVEFRDRYVAPRAGGQ